MEHSAAAVRADSLPDHTERHADGSRVNAHAEKIAAYRRPEVIEQYDDSRWGTRRRARGDQLEWRTLRKALAVVNNVRTLLDLPCGTGRFTKRLGDAGYVVTGADASCGMIGKALEKPGMCASFVCTDAMHLPYPDRSFDCVISARFLFHFDQPARLRLIREMARVSSRWL